MEIAVIGGGASGLMAALHAAWEGASVTLFERNTSLGRKLLVTGSGRCNLTNDEVGTNPYTCGDPAWLKAILDQFGVSELLETLKKIGIPTYKTWDGWYYPLSNSAHSVVDAMTHAVQSAGIKIQTASHVVDIALANGGFSVSFIFNNNSHQRNFEKIIVSAGGKAYPTLGTKGELYPIIANLGHTINPIKPALAPVLAELGDLKQLKGVRLDLGTALYQGTEQIASTAGNMIFTEWGLNGPAVMDLSHHIPDPPGDSIALSLNLLHFIEDEFNALLSQNRQKNFPVSLLLSAFFPPKVVQAYTNLAGIPEDKPLNEISDQNMNKLINKLKDTRLKVKGVRGYKYCQASTGGVPVHEVSPNSLESRMHKGMHFTGEILDVVGPCGGYNLHFAFASGAIAGRSASKTES
jgi:hypothetical protein